MDPATIQAMQSSPAKFQAELTIPSVHGPRRFEDVVAKFQTERFADINPALISIARGEKPAIGRHFWEATKGASKDSDLAVCLLWLMAFTTRPLSIQVGAADADQSDELRKAARDILRLNSPWLSERIVIKQWKIVCKKTNSEATIVPADVTGSHGARPHVLILNELSHIAKQEFAENLMDNASKVPNGLVVLASNAGFKGTWQHRWRELARTSPRWCFNVRSEPAPWLDDAEIEEARLRNSNTRFMRLFQGVWASGTGDALDYADITACIDAELKPMTCRDDQHSFVMGVDLGIKHDHSAVAVVGSNYETQRLRLADLRTWKPLSTTGQVDLQVIEETIADYHHRFDLEGVYYDPYEMSLMAQRLQTNDVPMRELTFVGKNLDRMAVTLMEVFRSRRLDMYPCPRLVDDLQRLTIAEKSYGHKLESVRDESGHADAATALAICLPAAVDGSGYNTRGRIDASLMMEQFGNPYSNRRPTNVHSNPTFGR